MQLHPSRKDCRNKRRKMRGEENKGKNRDGKLPRVFCYSEKFHHADWMIMSLEKCENEPAMPIDFEQSLRAEQPRRVVMTFRRVSYSIPWNFLSSNPLNPRKPSFLIACTQVRSLSFVLVNLSLAKKTPQLLAKIRNYRYIVLPTKRQKSIPPGCRTFPQFYSSRAILDIRGDGKISHVRYQWQYSRKLIIRSLEILQRTENFEDVWRCKRKFIASNIKFRLWNLIRDFSITSYIVYRGKNRNLFGRSITKAIGGTRFIDAIDCRMPGAAC